jgi:pyruvate,orthophosphate dikinase
VSKWVYSFGAGHNEGKAEMRNLLGGKGANLAEMASIGLPVPPGFTITTEVCTYYYDNGKQYPQELKDQVAAALALIEQAVGMRFGDHRKPLLVSVRSGARVSMPGMMDTVLNLGLNDETVDGLAAASGDPRFAWDSYRRFIQMFGSVVLGVDHHRFEEIIEEVKLARDVLEDTQLTADDWKTVVTGYKEMVAQVTGKPFPQDPEAQLWAAIGAVFGSWMNARANTYRRLHDIPANWGTAVNVQAMVFGNMGEDCATGVCFTRDPSTARTSSTASTSSTPRARMWWPASARRSPWRSSRRSRASAAWKSPCRRPTRSSSPSAPSSRRHYADMQDIRVHGQTEQALHAADPQRGKRTADRLAEDRRRHGTRGLIDQTEAIKRVEPLGARPAAAPDARPEGAAQAPRQGPAGEARGHAACGAVVFSADEAEGPRGRRARPSSSSASRRSRRTSTGMHPRGGILTTRGGMTSHAAAPVVRPRHEAGPCVAGAGGVTVDYSSQMLMAGGQTIAAARSSPSTARPARSSSAPSPWWSRSSRRLRHADGVGRRVRRLRVRANAETPLDADTARKFGAEGIGLCRTEHMFFDPERIGAVRQMIIGETEGGRREALSRLLPFQRADFIELFRIMAGLPVTIRLLDPPLHEFPAAQRVGDRRCGRPPRHRPGDDAAPRGRPLRGQPDARPQRLPARHLLPRRSTRCRPAPSSRPPWRRPRRRCGAGAGDHDPPRRHPPRARDHPRAGRQGGEGGLRRGPARRSSTMSAR